LTIEIIWNIVILDDEIWRFNNSMRIYLDNCCYNRPFDDLTQDRIRLEAEAILTIIKRAEAGLWKIVGGDVLLVEMCKIRDLKKQENVKWLYTIILESIPYSAEIKTLSEEIRSKSSITLYDSLHLASAYVADVDVFLSTDDKLIKAWKRLDYAMNVTNPINWFMEVSDQW